MTHHLTTSAQHSNTLEATPNIYVACLAAYNNGKLHGTWIDATLEPDAIMEATQAMLKASPEPDAEEWAIHDYDNFHGLRLSEWEGFAEVHAYATFIQEHGRLGAELIAYTGDIEHARAMMSDGYAGCYESLTDFAEELTEDITTIPQHLTGYIDYERMADDMEGTGEILTIKTAHDEVHVFWWR
jgi:antirestriction protein